jgi:ABC-type nitrate/sulfonate/bicarbonate transport system substrate-binding protein
VIDVASDTQIRWREVVGARHPSLRRLACGALVVFAVVLAAGCGDDKDNGSGRTYTVGIDIPFHPLLDYVIAKQDTYFAGKPYKVRFKVLDSTSLVPAFGTGKLDVIGTFPSFLPRIEERYGLIAQEFLPLARIKHGLAIWVPKDSSARTLADLKGAKVAAPPIGQQWGEDEAMIEAATGQSIRSYFDLQESAAPVQQLLLGRVKAAFVGAETVPQVVKAGGFRPLIDSKVIFERAYGDHFVLSGGLAAPSKFLAANRAFVDDLSAALGDAWRRYAADPRPVLAVASKQSGIAAEQIAGFGEAIGLSDISPARRKVAPSDVATWTKIYAALARSGFLKHAPADASKYFLVGV